MLSCVNDERWAFLVGCRTGHLLSRCFRGLCGLSIHTTRILIAVFKYGGDVYNESDGKLNIRSRDIHVSTYFIYM